MPEEVKTALPLSNVVFRAWSEDLVKLRCKLEKCNDDLSKECAELLKR